MAEMNKMNKVILEVLKESYENMQEWLREIERNLKIGEQIDDDLLEVTKALRRASQYAHYILKKHRIPHGCFNF